MTVVMRALRLDDVTWARLAAVASTASASLMVIGAYALLAFDRFGVQGVIEPRGAVRMLLAGFYGWMGLAAGSWLIARRVYGGPAPFLPVVRLFGHAHLPLLLIGITIQVAAGWLQVLGPGLAVGIFGLAVWMPALLVTAVATALDLDRRSAAFVVAGPYLVWLAVVGRYLESLLGHLL